MLPHPYSGNARPAGVGVRGAIPENTTTKRTKVLVVGDKNRAALRRSVNNTRKARKAFELQDKAKKSRSRPKTTSSVVSTAASWMEPR